MKIDTRELLERLSTSRREFNATAFAELDRNLSDEERDLRFVFFTFAAAEYSDWSGNHSVPDR